MQLQTIFDRLWKDYTEQNPAVKKVYDLLISEGETIENDHIAFRTFDDSRINIDVLSKAFIRAGYIYMSSYEFEEKHLFARHFEHPCYKDAPRVFISQLKTKDFSPFLQQTIKSIIDKLPQEILSSPDLIFSGNLWGMPSFAVYQQLLAESEYAAWLYVFGFRANHFTVSINSLKKYNDIRLLNEFLKQHQFSINDAGGEVKGSPAELLEQSSIRSGLVTVEFTEGTYEIPSCYYEFAKRYIGANCKLYSGFIAKSADKIFESTNFYNK
ncbi:MAG: DUF1338 domain-containing protein [Bacteroidota bacterium]